MKSFPLLLVFVVSTLFFSCHKSELSPEDNLDVFVDNSVNSNYVSIETAEFEVLAFVSDVDRVTKADIPARRISSKYSIGGYVQTKEGEESSPLVYVFNFADDRGFALASGDRRVSPVLCVTDRGSLNKGDVIDNPGLIMFLSEYEAYYKALTEKQSIANSEQIVKTKWIEPITILDPEDPDGPGIPPTHWEYGDWKTVSYAGTILPCQWSQEWPFNIYCYTKDQKEANVGCVAVAVGQIMYYWGKNYTYDGIYYDWDKMHEIKQTSAYPIGESWEKVQRLLSALGAKDNLDMNYDKEDGSGAYRTNTPRTFENFGYVSGGSIQDYDFNTLKKNLAYGPALGFGNCFKNVNVTSFLGIQIDKKTWYSGGHAWVFDQAFEQRQEVKTYQGDRLINTRNNPRYMVHINWGWGGLYDGYYLSGVFNTSRSVDITKGTTVTGTDDNYQFKLQMNCGIRAY